MSMCRVVSWVIGKRCFYDQHVLLTILLTFVLLHFVLHFETGQTCLFLQVSLDFLLLHSNPL